MLHVCVCTSASVYVRLSATFRSDSLIRLKFMLSYQNIVRRSSEARVRLTNKFTASYQKTRHTVTHGS